MTRVPGELLAALARHRHQASNGQADQRQRARLRNVVATRDGEGKRRTSQAQTSSDNGRDKLRNGFHIDSSWKTSLTFPTTQRMGRCSHCPANGSPEQSTCHSSPLLTYQALAPCGPDSSVRDVRKTDKPCTEI